MGKSNMEQDILKVLMSEEQLQKRVREMGDELYDRFHDKDPIFVGVLKGCFIFMAGLVRAAQIKSEIEFIGVSSYNNGTKSSGVVQITRDLQKDITGRHIIVVEDILDSGNTLYFLKNYLTTKGAASITILFVGPLVRKLLETHNIERTRGSNLMDGISTGFAGLVPYNPVCLNAVSLAIASGVVGESFSFLDFIPYNFQSIMLIVLFILSAITGVGRRFDKPQAAK